MYISIEDIKAHLNISIDFLGDDRLLKDYCVVAEKAVENFIQRPLTDFVSEDGLDPCLRQACLLYIGTLYANRESVSYSGAYTVPQTFEFLLAPYAKYHVTNS